MVTLHETQVDGVRCFWVETGRPTLTSLLVFRHGMADEPLNESGWQHLLEHLALHGTGGGALHTNGSVTTLETMFDSHGPAEAVKTHLARLTSRLTEPDEAELVRERDVLRAEADVRGSSVVGRALGWRYGAAGPGVVVGDDVALGRASAESLRDRAQRAFGRRNAVLMLDGPPPTGLTLSLPDGDLRPPSPAVPCPQPTPAAYVEHSGLVISGVVTRATAMSLGADVLRRAIEDRFRLQAGTAYAPWVTYERVDAERAVLLTGSDIRPAGRASLVADAIDVMHLLDDRGPDPAKLDEVKASYLQTIRDPYATFGLAVRAGGQVLQGRDPLSFDDMVAEVESLDVATVHAGIGEMRRTMLLGVPPDAPVGTQLPQLEHETTTPRPGGRRFRHVNWPAVREVLGVTEHTTEIRGPWGARAVTHSNLAGVIATEDGFRHLIRGDGYGISVDPDAWRGGAKAVARIDALVDPSLLLPHPARTEARFAAAGFAARWWAAGKLWMLAAVLLGVIVTAAIAFIPDIERARPPLLLLGLTVLVISFIADKKAPDE